MNVGSFFRLTLGICVVAVTAAGCTGISATRGALAALPQTHARVVKSWISPEAATAKQLLYAGDPTGDPSYSGVIDIFSLHGLKYTLVGQIQDDSAPDGMTTDASGDLYVTDMGVATEGPAVCDIKVYPKGSTQYSRFIVPGKWIPFDVAVDGGGTMYVSNIAPIGSFSPGSVSIFPPSASQPSRTLRLKNFQVYGITLHARTKTIYISYYADGSQGRIAEFKNARGKAIDFGITFAEPWGLLEDGSGNLLAADGAGTIEVYSEASHQLLRQIGVPNGAEWMAFDAARTRLYVSNFQQIEVLRYPGGKVIGTITQPGWGKTNYPTGLALWPPPP